MTAKSPKPKISKDALKPKASLSELPKPKEVVHLLEDEHRHLLSAALEGEAANERAARLKLERLILLARIDPEGRVLAFEKAVAECVDRLSKAETRHTEWTRRVKTRLALDSEFSFDSETGVVTTEISSGQ
jgi:hypothetical protein